MISFDNRLKKFLYSDICICSRSNWDFKQPKKESLENLQEYLPQVLNTLNMLMMFPMKPFRIEKQTR